MSSDATSFSGLEGIVVTSANLQAAAGSDENDYLKNRETTESSDVTESERNNAGTENLEFDDDLPTFIKKFKAWMHSNQLSQRVVAPVINVSQSHLCDLLNAKKQGFSWSNIAAAGRKPYHRMEKVMADEMILKALCLNRDTFRQQSRVKKRVSRPYNPNRLSLTIYQKKILEDAYTLAKYPSSTEYGKLATTLGITFRQVKTWFNNRRKLRCCPSSLRTSSEQDEDSYIEPMPESISRGIIVEEFRVENGEVVAVDPFISTDRDAEGLLPQEAREKTHHATGGNKNTMLTSYLSTLEERQLETTKQRIVQEYNENSAASSDGNVIEMEVDSQELRTNPEIKKDHQLEEVAKQGGHIEVRNGVVMNNTPFPSLIGDMVTLSKVQEEGAKKIPVTPPSCNPQGSIDMDIISSALVEPSNRTGGEKHLDVIVKTGNEDSSGDVLGMVPMTCQQSSASNHCAEKGASKMTDIQLKFLELTLEMHGSPSLEILDALSVLTCLEKEQIRQWFKNSLEGKTL